MVSIIRAIGSGILFLVLFWVFFLTFISIGVILAGGGQ